MTQLIKEAKRFQELAGINEAMVVNDKGELIGTPLDTTPRWAYYVNNKEDWDIISRILDQKGYKLAPGYTFSKYKLTDFNPFKSERSFGDKGEDDNDNGYSYAMSYQGENDFVLLSRPNKRLQIINPDYYDSRINSTYKKYKLYRNISDISNL